jgi:ribosome-associated translation inhibitor RaiA
MTTTVPGGDRPTAFEFVAGPDIPRAAEAYGRLKLGRVYRFAPAPVASARLTLDRAPEDGARRRCVGRATLDVDGQVVRAEAEGADVLETVDVLQERLRELLVRMADDRPARRNGQSPAS